MEEETSNETPSAIDHAPWSHDLFRLCRVAGRDVRSDEGTVRLSDSQLDQLKAGYSISQRCRGLATCAQNNQSNVFGTNVGGSAFGGIVLVFGDD